MKITVAGNESAFDQLAAQKIIEALGSKPNAVVGLSTGRTTYNMHRLAGAAYKAAPFDLSGVTVFGLDEIVGVPREYWGACYTMLRTEIVNDLGLPDGQFIMIPTLAEDYQAECDKFRAEIIKRGGIDVLFLGLGENGHLGFNQPGAPFDCVARVDNMHPYLDERVHKDLNAPADAVFLGATLGIADIMSARKIILVAKGKNKAEVVKQIITGPVTEEWPGSILQKHSNCEYLLDEDAASLL